MTINRKGMLPRIPGITSRFTFSRSDFLEGRVKCAFGPGQRQPLQYMSPTNWPAAGTRLRVPRAVWLSLYLRFGFDSSGTTFTQTWRNFYLDQRFSSVIAFFTGPDGTTPVYFGDGPYTTDTRNTDYEEHTRLLGVFNNVKDRIEGLTKARTSVEVIDWNDLDVNQNPDYNSDGFLQFASLDYDLDGNVVPFFGTNFLHVWAGHGLGANGNDRFEFDPYEPASPPSSDALYGNPTGRLSASYDRFRGHKTLLYYPDQEWFAPSRVPDPDSVGGITQYFPYETQMPIIQGYQRDLYDFFQSDMSDFGIESDGGTSQLDEDNLVSAIAAHFGFDPATGEDV